MRAARPEHLLDGVKFILRDDRRHKGFNHFVVRFFQLLAPVIDVGPVQADIGCARQDLMDHAEPPAPAGRCSDPSFVEIVSELAGAERSISVTQFERGET